MPGTLRTYTLTPGRRYSFGCRYRLGTASNLVMYVSAADNDYVGVTGTFLGTPLLGVWRAARLDFSVPLGGIAKLHFEAFGGSIPGLVQQSAGTLDLYSMQIRASAWRGLLRSAHSHRRRRRSHAVVHRGRVGQLAEHHGGGQRGPAELRHRNTGSTLTINTANAGNFTTAGDVSTGTLTASGAATQPPVRSRAPR